MATTKKSKQSNGSNRPTCDLCVVVDNGEERKPDWTSIFAGWQHGDGRGAGFLPQGQFEVGTMETDQGELKVLRLVQEHGGKLTKSRIGYFETVGGIEYFHFDGDIVVRDRKQTAA